jgi:type I site-specific restriction endonuclease
MPADALHESEWQTRKTRIDAALAASGWEVTPYRDTVPVSTFDRHAVEEYPTDNGPADYALVVGGRVLGIVEAKKVSLGPQNVRKRPVQGRLVGSVTMGTHSPARRPRRCPAPPAVPRSPSRSGAT